MSRIFDHLSVFDVLDAPWSAMKSIHILAFFRFFSIVLLRFPMLCEAQSLKLGQALLHPLAAVTATMSWFQWLVFLRMEATSGYGLLKLHFRAGVSEAFNEGKLVQERKGIVHVKIPISLSDVKAPCRLIIIKLHIDHIDWYCAYWLWYWWYIVRYCGYCVFCVYCGCHLYDVKFSFFILMHSRPRPHTGQCPVALPACFQISR